MLSIQEIEEKRKMAGISRRKLCLAARIHPNLVWRGITGQTSPRQVTLEKLEDALFAMIAKRAVIKNKEIEK